MTGEDTSGGITSFQNDVAGILLFFFPRLDSSTPKHRLFNERINEFDVFFVTPIVTKVSSQKN